MRLWKQTGQRPVRFEAFGVPVEVTLGDETLRPAVEEILPPGATPCAASKSSGKFGIGAAGADTYTVTAQGVPSFEHASLDVAVGMLDAQIRAFVAENAPNLIFVHAGAVAVDGRAMVIPGPSFSGKSTLVAALVEAGAAYYSDEYAVLDADGRLHPYARPISIRTTSNGASEERKVGEHGGIEGRRPADVAVVLLTRYRPGAVWRPTRKSTGEGVLSVLANTVPARARPQESLRALSSAIRSAIVLEGDRGETSDIVTQLLSTLSEAGA
jgi:hypothetical protein